MLCPLWARTTSGIHPCMHGQSGTGETFWFLGQSMRVRLWYVWHLLAHKDVIYFLYRKPGGGVCLGGLNQIKQPHVAEIFFAYPLQIGFVDEIVWPCLPPCTHYKTGFQDGSDK